MASFNKVILIGNLQRDFDRRGSAVGIKNLVQPVGRSLYEFPSQFDRRWPRQTEQRAVRNSIQLLANGIVDLGDAMSVHVAPQRRDAIEITVAVRVNQVETVTGGNDGRVLVPIRLHRSKGMPDVFVVPFSQGCRIHLSRPMILRSSGQA